MPIQKGPANLGTGSVDSTELASTLDLSAKTVTYRTIVAGDIASNAITTAKVADTAITPAKMANSGAEFGMRNRIINGAMVIDQRNAGASVTGNNGIYTLDRWYLNLDQNGKFNVQQNAGSVTPPVGFSNYLGITSTSAYSVPSGEAFVLDQKVEGYNIADLGWGTANAKTVTLSFWVYSSLTGTFSGNIQNSGRSRTYVFSYTITSANTWEQKSITIAGDTSGTWLTTNGIGLYLGFSLGTGTSKNTTAGSWGSTAYFGATGSTNVIGTNGATFYITGVQLEKGSTATSFDYRPYGTELALCQRYFAKLSAAGAAYTAFGVGRGNGGTSVLVHLKYPVTMRSAPTTVQSNTGVNYPSQTSITAITATYDGTDSSALEMTTSATVGAGICAVWCANNNGAAFVTLSAEL